MKTRSLSLVFLAVCAAGLGIFGLIRFIIYLSEPAPVLSAYLSQHELIIPSDSLLRPDVLEAKLSREALQTWIQAGSRESSPGDETLEEILRYLTVNIVLELPEDPLVTHTHYYHLEIENDSGKLFEKVSLKFPSIEAVEVRRKNSGPITLSEEDGRYMIGDIGPGESLDVYAWNNRPFYLQEENSVILRHGNKPVEIRNVKLVKPDSSWIMDNLILVALLGGLVLYSAQKMVFVIRMCSKKVDPDIEKRVNLE